MKTILTLMLVVIAATALAQDNCLEFDGDDFVSVPYNDALNNLLGNTITLEAWVLPYSLVYGRNPRVIQGGNISNHMYLYYGNEGGEDRVTFGFGGGYRQIHVNGVLEEGAWTHLAGVATGIELRIYVNGELQGIESSTGGTVSISQPMRIGGYAANYDYWIGQLDEIRIWNIARTQGQIQADMHTVFDGPTEGLIACWGFNEGSGDITSDCSEYGCTGFLNGPTWIQSSVAAKYSSWSEVKAIY